MSTVDMSCKLLCASESAYAISTSDTSGNYNPLEMLDPKTNKWVPDPSKAQYLKQYTAVGFKETPYVVVSEQIQAALIGKTDTEVIVAFRGTLPLAETWDSFFDWLQDLWASPTANPYIPAGKVHSGFMHAVEKLQEGIYNAIQAVDPSFSLPIYFTGHSKGGGMAPIAAMYFHTKYNTQIAQTITFAGPRPGDVDFCTSYDGVFPNDLRYENYLDIVPMLPPTPAFIDALELLPLPTEIKKLLKDGANWNYSSVGTLWYIDSAGVAKKYSALEADLLAVERITEISAALVTGNIDKVANAHHASCNFGYMNGTCPISVCS